jgi:hypothetical protein
MAKIIMIFVIISIISGSIMGFLISMFSGEYWKIDQFFVRMPFDRKPPHSFKYYFAVWLIGTLILSAGMMAGYWISVKD